MAIDVRFCPIKCIHYAKGETITLRFPIVSSRVKDFAPIYGRRCLDSGDGTFSLEMADEIEKYTIKSRVYCFVIYRQSPYNVERPSKGAIKMDETQPNDERDQATNEKISLLGAGRKTGRITKTAIAGEYHIESFH